MSALTQTSLPAPPITHTCWRRPCSRSYPSAQPVKAPAPPPRSGIAGLPACCLWPQLTVATGSSRRSVVHTSAQPSCQAAMVQTDTHTISRQVGPNRQSLITDQSQSDRMGLLYTCTCLGKREEDKGRQNNSNSNKKTLYYKTVLDRDIGR